MDNIFASKLWRKNKPGNHQLSNNFRFNFKQWNLKQDLQRGKTAEILSLCGEQVFLHPVICLNFYRIERSQRASSPKLFENIWTKVWLKTLRAASQKMRRKTCPKVATRRIVIWKVLKEKKLLAFGRINLLQEGGGETKSCPLLCSALILARSLSCFSSSTREERKGVATPSSTAGEFNLCDHWHRFLKVLLFNFMTFWSVQEMTVLLSSPK